MVTTWQLRGIRSINPTTMEVGIIEFLDGVEVRRINKNFDKSDTAEQVLNTFAQFIKQKRQQELDSRVPFNTLDLSDFETRIGNVA